ncbi:InlB B-repeat-containing protein [Clostridia bacterium]|nr:InlB B-repeat-containing protein [Clostridia bacterium]
MLKKKGMTLVETIVAITIAGILAIGVIPAFGSILQMTLRTMDVTVGAFDAQAHMESNIFDLKNAMLDPAIDELSLDGVSIVEYQNIFGRSVDMYQLDMVYPENEAKFMNVSLSKKLTEMQVHQLLVASNVHVEILNKTTHEVADMKDDPKPQLIGLVDANTDPNWYADLYHWYASMEGNPEPVFPDDYEEIYFGGISPSNLTDLTNLVNRYIMFTVVPVDIHGIRGNEVNSTNVIYVLGEEWKSGLFAWVDKDNNTNYVNTDDVKVEKSLMWPLNHGFDSLVPFQDPSQPDQTLDPSGGSLYVPMRIDVAPGDLIGPIDVNGTQKLEWYVDKNVNLATDIEVTNSSDIDITTRDGDITLYQYIKIDPSSGDAVIEDGRTKLIEDGPSLTTSGDINFETEGRGTVIFQEYSNLEADSISVIANGDIILYGTSMVAADDLILDTTKGLSFPGVRRILIHDSNLEFVANGQYGKTMQLISKDEISIEDTSFEGDTTKIGTVTLSAPDEIILDNVDFEYVDILVKDPAEMIEGGWTAGSTLTVEDGESITFTKGVRKVSNQGNLVVGNTGKIKFSNDMDTDLDNPLRLDLVKGSNDDEIIISSNYGRNLDYASASSASTFTGENVYQNVGSSRYNMEMAVDWKSGTGNPVQVSAAYDGENTITVSAAYSSIEPISEFYELSVRDKYSDNEIVGKINFRVTGGAGASTEVEILGSSVETFTVTFDKNGGDDNPVPGQMLVLDGSSLGSLPTSPNKVDYIFNGWNTKRDGSGSEFDENTVVESSITVYAQYELIPLISYIVTFDKNGGDNYPDPINIEVYEGLKIGTLPNPPTRAAHIFTGWNTRPYGNGDEVTSNTIVTESFTCYAQWKGQLSFNDLSIGDYVEIEGYNYQKVSDSKVLKRTMWGSNQDWWDADTVAYNYYYTISTPAVIDTGLLSRDEVLDLDTYAILANEGAWWTSSAKNKNQAYRVRNNGGITQSQKSTNSGVRPYLELDVDWYTLTVLSGSGSDSDPYILDLP